MTDESIPPAHEAVLLAKQGRLPGDEMLKRLIAGKMVVPVAGIPRIEYGVITGWRPATASRADGSQWLIAFTTEGLAGAYCDHDPDYGLYITVDSPWVLQNMPTEHGIAINFRTEYQILWNAQGLEKYKKDVLGW